ncbi:YybH family protein [Seonamhaeicola maritimus]|uniref:Nuclear transport factor 2 family protein n=1 Tax=Seonamhaeicola maritimus TaxID=2591822 RepID=A0A5C7GJK0_9FLAO|nr:nuclear transport factor 2 family protein [Seonamhaeicola maritimus]TXG38656.1 nuclear transport factor 2 family protein [Seonamhaeicola maritimus]
MKTKQILALLLFSLTFFLISCKEKPQEIAEVVKEEVKKVDLINDEFPQAKEEVMKTFGDIAQSILDGDIDKLISFHAYGPKFTEFNAGAPRVGSKENEAHERKVFGSVTEVLKFDAKDLKVAVYGDVANVTFHSDFHLKFGEDLVIVNDQITLLFVKTDDGWKLVHEHHSPLNKEN